MKKTKGKLTTSECDTDIQVLPLGQETYHQWNADCLCNPKVSMEKSGKYKIVHKDYENKNLEEIFDIAYHSPMHAIRQEIDC